MDKGVLPYAGYTAPQRKRSGFRILSALLLLATSSAFVWPLISYASVSTRTVTRPLHAEEILSRCQSIKAKPGPTADFYSRTESDRYVPGTPPTLIKNGRVWTGNNNGTEVYTGSLLLDKGLIKEIGDIQVASISHYGEDLVVIDANGSWVTPGIVDVHSHHGVYSSPELEGASDGNSFKGNTQPWLRSLDGLNTHDDSYRLSVSGGVTTSLILPGSANAIGGQAFVIKLRHTEERTPTSLLVEPPVQINGTYPGDGTTTPWRHMKHACGENPSRVYSGTRLDTIWDFRTAYNTARQLLKKQDEFCAKAEANEWEGLVDFPEDLQWEALVDVLRGRVKVNIHCYEAVDLDDLVRLSNEFQFPIAAFHHAHETYLVPDLLKKAWGAPPAVAIFATNARYKREAYRGSEFAAKILADHGLDVNFKSDHSVLDSRFLIYEAQQGHFYGLEPALALAAVTSTSAKTIGLDHRLGFLRPGYDADVVVWDSHPLALGATPKQVFIDGLAQFETPHVVTKPEKFNEVPTVPNFDKEAKDAVKYDGLPPLTPKKSSKDVLFVNVAKLYLPQSNTVREQIIAADGLGVVLTRAGKIVCLGKAACETQTVGEPTIVDLQGGALSPGLASYGSPIGLENIAQESSTNDGVIFDPLANGYLGGDTTLIRGVDGLLYETRDALLAYVYGGVTTGIVAPVHGGFYGGLGVAFSLGASHKLEVGAVLQEVTAVHASVRQTFGGIPSVSTQIGTLRRLLLSPPDGDAGSWFAKVANGEVTLVVDAHGKDIIASLIALKKEVESIKSSTVKLTLVGASEAHHLAKELGENGVGVIVSPPKPFPAYWEDSRLLPGPPLSQDTIITALYKHNVTVGLGNPEIWSSRNLRFEIGYAALQADGLLSKGEALALGSTNLEKLLGAEVEAEESDLVATLGGELTDFSSKVVAVVSPRRGIVDLV